MFIVDSQKCHVLNFRFDVLSVILKVMFLLLIG